MTDARPAWRLAALSAAVAACHESVAPSLLARWTGNSAWATGLALTVFLGGMGAGSLLPVRWPAMLRRARRTYALAELVVALSVALATAVIVSLAPPSTWLGGGHALDVLAAALLLLPASLAMGVTYPAMVAARREPGAAPGLYAAGLAGACVGALGAAGAIVPRVGTLVTAAVAIVANLVCAGLSRVWLDDGDADDAPVTAPSVDARDATARFAAAGLFGLGAQSVWNRVLVPYAGVSLFAFASIVAVYVAAQSAGFALTKRIAFLRTPWAPALAPAVALASLALCPAVSSWSGDRQGAALPWALGTIAALAVLAGPTALLLGAAQAQSLDALDAHPQRAQAVARASGIGTLLSSLGALVASLVLVPAVGPRVTLALLAAPLALTTARRARSAGITALALTAALTVIAPGPRWFLGASFDGSRVLYGHFGVQDTAAVVLHDQPVEPAIRRLVAAGVSYSGDSLFAQRYMRLLAHLPSLATARRDRAAVVCVGTGTTLDALRLHGFARVDAIDIDPTVRDTLRWFERAHHGAPDDARVHLVIEDGDRQLVATAPGTYDVITLEPPPPRAPGGSTLYTLEFYRRAKRALRDDGVLAQWLPLHDLGAREADALVATFLAVFPDAELHLAERNEAVLVSRRASGAVPASAALDDDLARIGFARRDPSADTRWLDARALATLTRGAPIVTRAWPMPELAPLSLPSPVEPLDVWAARAAQLATPASPESYAAVIGPVVANFLRVVERRGRGDDRARVTEAMATLLRARPDDDYTRYSHGFGSYLRARLDALAGEGVDAAVIEVTRRRIDALEARSNSAR